MSIDEKLKELMEQYGSWEVTESFIRIGMNQWKDEATVKEMVFTDFDVKCEAQNLSMFFRERFRNYLKDNI